MHLCVFDVLAENAQTIIVNANCVARNGLPKRGEIRSEKIILFSAQPGGTGQQHTPPCYDFLQISRIFKTTRLLQ